MIGFLTVLTLQLACSGPAASDPAISPADFRIHFDAARKGKLSIPDAVIDEARRYRYVFVGGFHSERLPGYFAQNAKELRANGVPKRSIHFIYPSSHETVDGNATMVREIFEDIASQGPEKLVVIAHSRGSCDALAFALQNPEFVEEHIHALFLIQGAFGGTAIADYMVGDGPPIDKRMPLGQRVVARALTKAEGYLLDHGKHGGLESLTRQASEEFWQDVLEENSAAIPIVGPKTYYVTSQIPPSGRRFLQRPLASYLETHFGENDGVIALEDQAVPELGTVLAVLDAGHTDLTNRFPSGRAAQRMRKAVIDAIVMSVGDDKPSNARERTPGTRKSPSVDRTARKGRAVSTDRR
jgi:pimeloyl-ACP methyl ester carboxylesterase